MKKFISMVMAAAMVVTMVPATAFAANTASAKVVNPLEVTANEVADYGKKVSTLATNQNNALLPQLQLEVTSADALMAQDDTYKVTLKFDNFDVASGEVYAMVYRAEDANKVLETKAALTGTAVDTANDKVTYEFKAEATGNNAYDLQKGDIIAFDLDGTFDKAKVGSKATVKVVDGDFGTTDAMVFASVVEKGIKVELDDEVVKVAPEESETLETVVIKPTAGYDFNDVMDFGYKYDTTAKEWNADKDNGTHAKIVLKLSKGFDFLNSKTNAIEVKTDGFQNAFSAENISYADDTITIYLPEGRGTSTELTVKGIDVEAATAKAGAEATIKVSANKLDSVSVVVAEVIDMKVVMELVDADEDVPVFYNGVDVDNTGLTVEDDHISLEVKIYETFKGAWSNHKNFTLSLPEGVFVTAVEADDVNSTFTGTEEDALTGSNYDFDQELEDLFEEAYVKGGHENFEFKKYSYNETHDHDDAAKAHEIKFTLELIAEPDFVGDVVLKLEGAALDTQEVTIAKFVAPYTVKAEQNDVIIDYRYTEVPTAVVITEAEAGLWAEGLTVTMGVEDNATDLIKFEDEATYAVNEESEMEIDEINSVDGFGFKVTEESKEEAAVVTIEGVELFMQRNIPAGPYALEVIANSATTAYSEVALLGQDVCDHSGCDVAVDADGAVVLGKTVEDIDDYSTTVHEAWVNVVTAGRDQDDNSFTTTVVVPVGETTIYAGEKAITLDVPAYINANGYIMVPVRAVANALGIANDCVQWNQAAKTVIIMYGNRLITMAAGSSTIYVGGAPLPAASSVEVVDGRAFLGLRDLANALGVKTIDWNAETKVGTLNPKA